MHSMGGHGHGRDLVSGFSTMFGVLDPRPRLDRWGRNISTRGTPALA